MLEILGEGHGKVAGGIDGKGAVGVVSGPPQELSQGRIVEHGIQLVDKRHLLWVFVLLFKLGRLRFWWASQVLQSSGHGGRQ